MSQEFENVFMQRSLFMKKPALFATLLLIILLIGCQSTPAASPTPPATETAVPPQPTATIDPIPTLNAQAFAANQQLGRGVNLGNALDAPSEGAWGLYLQEQYFADIAEAGFDHVRVPIRWTAYASLEPPYTIKPRIFKRIDWVIEQAFAHDLAVVIDVHHFEAIMQQPESQAERLAGIWQQIADHYKDYPNTLYFEILNEPNENLDSETWNTIFPQALAAIRQTNPDRYVIIGPDMWNNVGRLSTLELPADDRHLIVTFHYYSPHEFTHQGAPWSSSFDVKDLPWGSEADVKALQADFDAAQAWAEAEQRPLYIGEFGVYSQAPEASRILWLAAVREEAEKRGFSWAVWDFGTDFAIYTLHSREWKEPLLRALIPES